MLSRAQSGHMARSIESLLKPTLPHRCRHEFACTYSMRHGPLAGDRWANIRFN